MQVFPLHTDSAEVPGIMERYTVSHTGIELMRDRFLQRTFVVKGLSSQGSNALKQHLLSLGGEAALPKHAIAGGPDKCDLIFSLRDDRFPALLERLRMQCFHLPELADAIQKFRAATGPWYDFRHDRIPADRPAVMAILNVTPDSFSDGGRWATPDAAVARADELIAAGSDILDIGGESTRPGAAPVDADEETRRVVPVIARVRKAHPAAVISIDTAKAAVAAAALEAGADIVNDITAGADPAMLGLVARAAVPYVMMHIQGTPRTMQQDPRYDDILADINAYFDAAIVRALDAGVKRERLILDPGFGFGKSAAHNLTLLKHLEAFTIHCLPLLAGLSRKSFIGAVTGRKDAGDRLAGTLVAQTIALSKGAAILRVHDVAAARDIILMHRAVREAPCC
ncbi:MAG TPA: dihydropteroate synthase [bacterium]|nr:dihydropteroate synthase [bacterium]